MALLEVRGLVKFFGRRKVVDGVSFEVNPGEVVGLLGPNGAGKTTSFRMTTGQLVPNEGTVLFDGQDVSHDPMYRRARLGMGYLSQESSVFRRLTVEQNILAILEAMPFSRSLGRKLRSRERWERTNEVLKRFNLEHVRHTPAGRASGGEKRRLEIARCLVCEPLLIMLDEPFAAVDPRTTEDIRSNIRELAVSGIGILLTDHNVREVLKITDRSYLIKDGQVVTQGTPTKLINDPIAIQAYLGNTFVDDGLWMQAIAERHGQAATANGTTTSGVPTTPAQPASAPSQTAASAPVAPVVAPTVAPAASSESQSPTSSPAPTASNGAGNAPTPGSVYRFGDPAPAPMPSAPLSAPVSPLPPMTAPVSAAPQAASTPTAPAEAAASRVPTIPIMPPTTMTPAAGTRPERPAPGPTPVTEQDHIRRLIELLTVNEHARNAATELVARGRTTLPALFAALERRDVNLRHRAWQVVQQILVISGGYDPFAPEDQRRRQLAQLRDATERRAG
ncbi:LPS export ABC transporter ATP-binding protein [Tuwongella immobilis]|uniref:ABC transporter domain-containing protein n=1 Tax=Tuwongella immobilis TaxID=692036 RepID=A0A6C2YSP4_9BACT|nr:LPS export ABC transporter ATP-binding protein [Tuwongella immobilis]VIP04163.1 abc transporter : ABC-type (Unclassified) transport system, ATPase component OS=Singulisphaera acidiphila (strain ATCC BAA-1392 / DSM 18658 / VKM B-2454 / MOB10) GN=Sinac_1883 PE=3 SV=1: ABC_tran [Tuwongella immobilis]VTS05691.1 abc transporter : ABC-type (Unclassified) transport system, ATPase component OS=Singulisphaera acidiphila (strain ATCC BAA-1392 / DSM 18658 / VKM B-2454 / MOB10) GN=Sinac_1883 PE=3 SV=1: AB